MAKSYSFGNFQSMQEDAIKRVLEMQRQSKEITEEKAPESTQKTDTDLTLKPKQKPAPKTGQKPIIRNQNNLSDEALLIALLLLLTNEKADAALILALIYILI